MVLNKISIETKRIRMKLENEEKNYLNELLRNQINLINADLEQNDLDEDKIKKMIDEGNYELEEVINKRNSFIKILNKVSVSTTPGASSKQMTQLFNTANKRTKNSEEKILKILDYMYTYDLKMTISTVSTETKMSYNTIKKFKTIIDKKESQRLLLKEIIKKVS